MSHPRKILFFLLPSCFVFQVSSVPSVQKIIITIFSVKEKLSQMEMSTLYAFLIPFSSSPEGAAVLHSVLLIHRHVFIIFLHKNILLFFSFFFQMKLLVFLLSGYILKIELQDLLVIDQMWGVRKEDEPKISISYVEISVSSPSSTDESIIQCLPFTFSVFNYF